MRLSKTYIAVITVLFLNSCVSYTGPEDNVVLSDSTELEQLTGLYKNSGDPSGHLSVFIWGRAPINSELYKTFLKHDEIKYIKVVSKENSIIVSAVTRSCIAYEKEYALGDDLVINNGQIILSQDSHLLSRGSGDPLVGPSTYRVTLNLDTHGHGVYKNESYAIGLICLLVPATFSDAHEVRFERSNVNKSYHVCYKR